MARQLFFAITLIGIGGLLNSSVEAGTGSWQCEDQAANCVGRCANPSSGTNDNKCMWRCDRRVTACMIRVHESIRRW
jgi:hypothetical protein